MGAVWIILAVFNTGAWLLPTPTDKLGWALRIRALEDLQPLLTEETIDHQEIEILLINRSKKTCRYTPLSAAARFGSLQVLIIEPNGKALASFHTNPQRELAKEYAQLAEGQFESFAFMLIRAGYTKLPRPGKYEVRVSLKTDDGVISAPIVKLKVIEPASADILTTLPVSLEGQEAKYPKNKQERPVIQQIKIGDRTWLFYRRFMRPELGGAVHAAFRIAELPGRVVDLKVEGAFGDWNPLTITYREHTYTKWTTTHIINSVDGRPWTAAEEKHRQEKLKLEAKPPADKD